MTQITEVKDESELQEEFDKMLKKLAKTLNGNFVTNVGVLGSSSARPDADIDNAGLGLVHEFGSKTMNIPPRSWLRMPILHRIKMILKAVSNQQRSIEQAFEKEDGEKVYQILGLACESAIQEAFDSNGFGTWAPNSKLTVDGGWGVNGKTGKPFFTKGKKSSTPLIDTGEFRQSVISVVKRK